MFPYILIHHLKLTCLTITLNLSSSFILFFQSACKIHIITISKNPAEPVTKACTPKQRDEGMRWGRHGRNREQGHGVGGASLGLKLVQGSNSVTDMVSFTFGVPLLGVALQTRTHCCCPGFQISLGVTCLCATSRLLKLSFQAILSPRAFNH